MAVETYAAKNAPKPNSEPIPTVDEPMDSEDDIPVEAE